MRGPCGAWRVACSERSLMRGPHPLSDPRTVIVDETAVTDFAFADTVVATDLDEAIPPSGLVIHNEAGHAHCLTPPEYPYLTAQYRAGGPGITTKMHGVWARMREKMQASRAEMTELWSATASLEHVEDGRGAAVYEEAPLARAATMGRRVRAFFSFFEWDRADLLRAAWIGLLVFVLVATVGAFALQGGHGASEPHVLMGAPTSAEVSFDTRTR